MKKLFALISLVLLLLFGGGYVWLFHVPTDRLGPPPSPPPDFAQELGVPSEVKVVLAQEQVEGFPETVTIHTGNEELLTELTGHFTRSRNLLLITLNLYEIASYVEAPEKGETELLLNGLLEDNCPKVYLIRFRMKLPGKAVLKAITDEINATFTDVDMDRLKENIDRFVGQFAGGASAGDMIYVARLPGGLVYSSINAPEHLGLIAEDQPLARALWRIWAGETSGPERVGLVKRFATDADGK